MELRINCPPRGCSPASTDCFSHPGVIFPPPSLLPLCLFFVGALSSFSLAVLFVAGDSHRGGRGEKRGRGEAGRPGPARPVDSPPRRSSLCLVSQPPFPSTFPSVCQRLSAMALHEFTGNKRIRGICGGMPGRPLIFSFISLLSSFPYLIISSWDRLPPKRRIK